MPVTWSDEKLILLYCPGRGSNSRPHAHRSFKHGQGVLLPYPLGHGGGYLSKMQPVVLLVQTCLQCLRSILESTKLPVFRTCIHTHTLTHTHTHAHTHTLARTHAYTHNLCGTSTRAFLINFHNWSPLETSQTLKLPRHNIPSRR